jgi:hypothetical protein
MLNDTMRIVERHLNAGPDPANTGPDTIFYKLPLSPPNSLKTCIVSTGKANLPRGARPCNEATEKLVVNSLLSCLKDKFKLRVDCDPQTNRDVTASSPKECLKYVVIRGSHAAKTGAAMAVKSPGVHHLGILHYRTSSIHAGKIQQELKKLAVGPNTVIVVQVFESGLYMAAPGEGGLIPPSKRLDGSYHMDGDLVLLPKELQYDLFKQLVLELDSYKNNTVIFMGPLPQYLERGCCSDVDHMKNRQDPEFKKKLEEGVYAARTNIKNSAFRHKLRKSVTISSWSTVKRMNVIWEDQVHLVEAGYQLLAEAIFGAVVEANKKRSGGPVLGAPAAKRPKTEAGGQRGGVATTIRGRQDGNSSQGRGGGHRHNYYTDGYRFYSGHGAGYNAEAGRGGYRGWHGGRPFRSNNRGRGAPH